MPPLRAAKPGHKQKPTRIIEAAKAAMAPYEDYRKSLADGYQILLPRNGRTQYYFTNHEHAHEAWFHLDRSNRRRCSVESERECPMVDKISIGSELA
jgi:hypothetical protein